MKSIANSWILVLLFSCLTGCKGQAVKTDEPKMMTVGGGCEGCDMMYTGMPDNLSSTDTSAGWMQPGQKLLVTGTMYKIDGRTPAPGVILYYYQTNTAGRYLHKPDIKRSMAPNELGQTHGHIRGWVKTGADGKYAIYTVRPGAYPTRNEPAHIHLIVKEPNDINEYYIDDLVFDDDSLLTTEKRKRLENRGGSGVLRVLLSGNWQVAEHNIVLGLHIPGNPGADPDRIQSGLQIGEDNPSFIPYHAWGPDKGTRVCPVCKYGRYHGIIYFVGNNPNWNEINSWLTFLEQESVTRSNYLKAYFVYGNDKDYSKSTRQQELENIGRELGLKNIALTFVPSLTDTETEANLNKINPDVDNTFIIFKHRSIVDKFINLKATPGNFKLISSTLDKTKGDYFQLSELNHE